MKPTTLSQRAYSQILTAGSWEEIWEAGPYFDRISELLEDAKEYAIFVGWQIDSRLPLKKPQRPNQVLEIHPSSSETLKEKIIRICELKPDFQFYFLFWDHAYFYVFEREVWQGRVWENIHPRVHFVFDNRHPLGGSHHEKICIIDGKVAFCGGIDLCDERWDSPQHLYFDPRRSLTKRTENHGPYHDLAVQVTGPICGEIQRHIQDRWKNLSSLYFPVPHSFRNFPTHGTYHKVYLSRTVSEIERSIRKKGFVREIEFLFRDLILCAERRIILEGQYYWSEVVNDLLISKVHQMSGKNFEIYIILAVPQTIKSLTRYMTTYEMKLIRRLMLAAEYAGVKVVVGSPYAVMSSINHFLPPRPIYIHSKICVIDDRFLSIGSANFAARALRMDTEINLTFEAQSEMERKHIERVSQYVIKHWNLKETHLDSGVCFRTLKPRPELWHLKTSLAWTRRFSWQWLIDPRVPWFYFFKLRIRKWLLHSLQARVILFGLMILLSFEFVRAFIGSQVTKDRWTIFYSLFISSIWLLPVPYLSVVILASFYLGLNTSLRIGVAALWVASFFGYSLARAFPDTVGRFYRKQSQADLSKKLGRRTFSDLIAVLLDPRIGIHTKIIYQGLYCVPWPWFVFGTGVLLPAVLTTTARWIWALVIFILPGTILQIISQYVGLLLFLIFLFCVGRVIASIWKNAD